MEFNFTKNAKNFFMVLMAIGVVTIIAGFLINPHRTWSALLVNDFYFLAIALCGTFFVAVNTIAQAGWAVGFRRIPEAMGTFIFFGGIGMILIFIFGHHDLYQWTHPEYYNKFLAGTKTPNPDYDKIFDGKKGFLNV